MIATATQRLLDVGVTQLLQVTLVIVLAIAITSMRGLRRRPHVAYAVWLLVLIKCLTPPIWSSPTGVFSWARAERATTFASTAPNAMPEFAPITAQPDEPVIAPVSAPKRALSIDSTTIVIALWGLGAVVLLLTGVVRSARLRRGIERGRTEPPVDAVSLFDELRQSLGVRVPVSLVVTTHPIGPALLGVVRPIVVVPEALLHDRRNLRTALAHELVHLRRFDHVVAFVQTLALAAWWFHPLAWWMSRSITRVRELCCDEQTIAELNCEPESYLQMLLDLARARRAPGIALGVSAMQVTKQRMEHLMDQTTRFHRRAPLSAWIALLLLSVLLLPGAGLALRQSPATAPSTQPATADAQVGDDAHLIGTVIDKSTGQPVDGATVRINRVRLQESGGKIEWPPTLVGTATTDANGVYDFRFPLAGAVDRRDGAEVWVSHPQYASVYHLRGLFDRRGDKPNKTDRVEVLPGETITGVVQDPDGKPLADCEISYRSMVGPIEKIHLQHGPELTLGGVRTDANGRFEFNALKGATYTRAVVLPDDYAITRVPIRDPRGAIDLGTDVGVIKVVRGQRIRGRVVDGGNEPVRLHTGGMDGERSAETDAEGNFEFAPLPPGRYTIRTDDVRYLPKEVEIADAPPAPLEFRASPMVTIRARTVDSSGRALTTASLFFAGKVGEQSHWTDVRSTPDGRFEFQVPRGLSDARFSVSHDESRVVHWRRGDDLTPHGGDLRIERLDGDVDDITFVVLRTAGLRLQITDASGQNPSDARVWVQYADEELRMPQGTSWRHGSTGDAPIEKLPAGRQRVHLLAPDKSFTLYVEAPGHQTYFQKLELKEGEQRELEVKLVRAGAR